VRDVLTAAGGGALAAPPAFAGPVEARMPRDRRGWRAAWALVRMFGRDFGRTLRWGRMRHLSAEQAAPVQGRRYRVAGALLDAETSARLTERARAERTTVHGALSAALLQAVAALEGGPRTLGCGSAVDLRRRMDPPLADEVMFAVSAVTSTHRVDPHGDLWALARRVRDDLTADVERGAAHAFHTFQRRMLPIVDLGRPAPPAFADRLYRLRMTTTGVTNLGRLDVPRQYGPLTAETLGFVVGPSALADLVTTSTAFADRISWWFVGAEPYVSAERLRRIADEAHRRLAAAV
jgi:hypothetical protein